MTEQKNEFKSEVARLYLCTDICEFNSFATNDVFFSKVVVITCKAVLCN